MFFFFPYHCCIFLLGISLFFLLRYYATLVKEEVILASAARRVEGRHKSGFSERSLFFFNPTLVFSSKTTTRLYENWLSWKEKAVCKIFKIWDKRCKMKYRGTEQNNITVSAGGYSSIVVVLGCWWRSFISHVSHADPGAADPWGRSRHERPRSGSHSWGRGSGGHAVHCRGLLYIFLYTRKCITNDVQRLYFIVV